MNEKQNNKKLIGTIIGVIFFAILIAGATFAWLTFSLIVNNGVYNTTTMNFLVNYEGGMDLTSLPMLEGNISVSTCTGCTPITVSASKANIDGTLYLKMHTANDSDSMTLAEGGSINYAVCVGTTCTSNSSTAFSQISGVTTGTIDTSSMDEYNDIIIYTGPLTASTTYYNIYFWIDAETITSEAIGLDYSGYVHAFAVQNELGSTSSPSSSS